MKKLIIMLLAAAIPAMGMGQKAKIRKANEETAEWRYEVEPVTVGNGGSIVVKVWSYSKDPNVAQEQAKKNAVHGVVFKGVTAQNGQPGRKALAPGREGDSFFASFFGEGGDYMRFVSLTNSGALGAGDVVKTAKKEFKVGVQVTVDYNALRAHLEQGGVVKRLDSGF